ncbi:MAG: molybdopterin-dependent oxidoreductase [Gammaproteobacteria bacterium]|nr:molybdopterin-dependent oxidoreductase [Gammaproteobacteria bacterium]
MGKISRRAFIATGLLAGGGIALGIGVRLGHRTPELASLVAKDSGILLNAWLKIFPDNSITVITPHVEMGQGANSVLAMMLADELDADWDTVSLEQAPAHEAYSNFHMVREYILPVQVPEMFEDTVNGALLKVAQGMSMQVTGGSFSIRSTGQRGMRVAGAAARKLFVDAAANEWGVPADEINVENSHLIHSASNNKAPFIAFAEQVATERGELVPTLKTPDQYKLMGKDIPRMDIPEKVDGSAIFGVDVELPGMKYATVRNAPVFGSSVVDFNAAAVKKMPGVQKVVNLGDAIGVIADGYWQAKKATDALEIKYSDTGHGQSSSEKLFSEQRDSLDNAVAKGDEKKDFSHGKARQQIERADHTLAAEYQVPTLAHATMEPMNATAWVQGEKISLWGGLQNPLRVRNHLIEALGYDAENVEVHTTYLGGGFGRRSTTDYPEQAAKLAAALPGVPVKMIWSREEDIQHDVYRTATVARLKAGLNSKQMPVAWDMQYVDKNDPADATLVHYDIPHQFVHYTDTPTHVPFGPWRSVDHTQHAFFIESFIDELAHNAKLDPFEFRRNLLAKNPRMQTVLETVAKMANWGRPMPPGWGQGIAIHTAFGTTAAEVVEVDVSTGTPKVKKVYCAADPGFAMHPDGFIAQMESGIIYGLTAALYGDIQIRQGAVNQSNFHDYKMLRMDEAPDIEVAIINGGGRLGGGGEPGTPPVSPALTNAIFAATGKRIRELPVSRHDRSYS